MEPLEIVRQLKEQKARRIEEKKQRRRNNYRRFLERQKIKRAKGQQD